MSSTICLLLMAGKGTRMGTKGKFIPKPLWPILDKRLIDLQISYLKWLGMDEIWINLFHQKEMILDYLKKYEHDDKVKVLIEDELLDVGGAIHNFILHNPQHSQKKLWVFCGDQFISLKEKDLTEIEAQMPTKGNSILGIEVEKIYEYNKIIASSENNLKEIIKFEKTKFPSKYLTYSGIGRVDLSTVSAQKGPSKFFETICPYKKSPVKIIDLKKGQYWDFGTSKRYEETISKLKLALKNKKTYLNDPFLSFCKNHLKSLI